MKKKAESKKVIQLKAEDINFGGDLFEESEMPGCCSLPVLHHFQGVEARFEEAIDDAVYDAQYEYGHLDEYDKCPEIELPPTAELEAAKFKALVEQMNVKQALIALSEHQTLARKAAEKAGFKKVGSYKGEEGTITLFQKGLRLPRH